MGLPHLRWLTPGTHAHLCFPRKPALSSDQEHGSQQNSNFQDSEHTEELLKELVEINILWVIWQKEDIVLHITPKFIISFFFPLTPLSIDMFWFYPFCLLLNLVISAYFFCLFLLHSFSC